MLKLSDNPPVLFPQAPGLETFKGPWWVAHTKARNEKAFARDLISRQIPYFLPLVERVTFSGGRKRRGMLPLFAGYVFFCGDEAARYAAMATDRLCQVIEAKDQSGLKSELACLHRVIKEGTPLDPYAGLAVGAHCRITAGPLQGIEGTLIRRDGVTRLVLSVSMLGQGADLQIEPDLIEVLEDRMGQDQEDMA